jgi:hypothetical protein
VLSERYDALPPAARRDMTFDEFAALHSYTGSDLYRPVNQALRGGDPSAIDGVQAPVRHIDGALQRIPPVAPDSLVSRRVMMRREHHERYLNAVGGELVESSYVSTSAGSVSAPVNLVNRNPGEIESRFSIRTSSGRDISTFSAKRGEGEVVIPRGTRFRVERAEYRDPIVPGGPQTFHVDMVEIPDPSSTRR